MKYDIIGKSICPFGKALSKYDKDRHGTEVIDTASDLKEAEYLVKEYQLSFGNKWIITHKLIK